MTRLLPLGVVSGILGTLELIVEREFGIGWNIRASKEADTSVTQHGPLLCFAVWLARVVHEASQIATWAGVDHAIVVQSEEVIRFVTSILLIFETTPEFMVVNHFTDVFDDKLAFLNVCLGLETPAFTVGIERVERRREPLLKPLIFTPAFARADTRITFKQQHP